MSHQASWTEAKANGVKSKPADKAVSALPGTRAARPKTPLKEDVEDAAAAARRCEGILCAAAMDNLYYIAHDAADALRLRGFRWHKLGAGAKRGKKAKI